MKRRRFLSLSGAGVVGTLAGCSGGGGGGGSGGGGGGDGDSSGGDSNSGDSDSGGASSDLVEAAKNESGTLRFYHSAPTEAGAQILKAFKQKYPFVEGTDNVRGPSSDITARIDSELNAGELKADVVHQTQPQTWVQWRDNGQLLKYQSSEADAYPDEFVNEYWAPARFFTMPWTFNTSDISKGDLPTSWPDLVDYAVNNYSGSIGWGAADGGGVALNDMWVLDREFGDEAWAWLEKAAETGASYYTSHGAMSNDAVSGAISISQNQLSYRINSFRMDGAPVGGLWPDEGVTVQQCPIAILEKSDMTATSKLFVDYLLSAEGQQTMQEVYGGYSLRNPQPVDQPHLPALDDINQWTFSFDEIAGDTQRIIDRFKQVTGR